MEKLSFSGYTMYFRWSHVSHSTRILLFDFDDNFRRYSLWVRPFRKKVVSGECAEGNKAVKKTT